MTARVLVVDDILANVKLLEARLSAEYFQVLTAHNGQEALDLLKAEHVDVVLLDVMMPGMDGFEVCRRIKQNAGTAHTPVIMVTALDQPSDKIQGLRAGADDFLAKPIDETALITRVKNLARLKALNDEVCRRAISNVEAGLVPPAARQRILPRMVHAYLSWRTTSAPFSAWWRPWRNRTPSMSRPTSRPRWLTSPIRHATWLSSACRYGRPTAFGFAARSVRWSV